MGGRGYRETLDLAWSEWFPDREKLEGAKVLRIPLTTRTGRDGPCLVQYQGPGQQTETETGRPEGTTRPAKRGVDRGMCLQNEATGKMCQVWWDKDVSFDDDRIGPYP